VRLTLRTLLAYLDDTLDPAEIKRIGQKVAESETARELIARIKALLRRPGGALGRTLDAGNVSLDTVGRELKIVGKPIRVPRRELAILEEMMRRFGRIVPKAVLEEKLYGIDEEPDSNPIPVHVHYLRRQLQIANASLAIHTVRGVGYILTENKK